MTATQAAPPLTRRQAREIERRTGKRPVAVSPTFISAPASAPIAPSAARDEAALANGVRDRIRIATATAREQVRREATETRANIITLPVGDAGVTERDDDALSTTGELARGSVDAEIVDLPAAFGGGVAARGASIKAATPRILVRRERRRRVLIGAAAASLAGAAAVGAAVPGLSLDSAIAGASLVSPDSVADDAADQPDQATASPDAGVAAAGGATGETSTVPYVEAPAEAPNLEDYDYAVYSVSAEGVEGETAPPVAAPTFEHPYPTGAMNEGYGTRGGAHNGIDMVGGGCGADLVAVTGGTVTFAGEQGSYGNHVELDLGDGTTISYSHIQPGGIQVAVGQEVQAGDIVGLVGTTGRSTGCHLHFEVKVDGSFVDPVGWLAERGITV
ncbi:MAG: M23 family metallopeptidase [Pseudoclavibacter sp.]